MLRGCCAWCTVIVVLCWGVEVVLMVSVAAVGVVVLLLCWYVAVDAVGVLRLCWVVLCSYGAFVCGVISWLLVLLRRLGCRWYDVCVCCDVVTCVTMVLVLCVCGVC